MPAKTSFGLWCFLMCIASWIIIAEKPADTRNSVELKPSVSPAAVQSALTNAECELGIPPVSKNAFVLLEIKILSAWLNSQALNTLIIINFIPI